MMDYVLILGTIGLLILLIAFVVEHLHRKRSRLWFNWLNLVGSLILGVYAIYTWNLIFIILEFVWAAVSLFYLLRKE